MKPTTLAQKFGVPQSLVDYISKSIEEETEYQSKVKAHMAKKGIKSLGDLTPDEKKKFFNDLDAAHKAKNEEVETVDEAESHQSKTTMKHIDKPNAAELAAAKRIKPGIKGVGDRFAMLKAAKDRGALKEEEQTDEAVVKGKGYDKPENERKGPEGKVPMTSLLPGHNDKAARLAAVQAKGKLVKGKAQSAPQKEDYELTQEDLDFINSLNEKK